MDLNPVSLLVKKEVLLRTEHIEQAATNSRSNHLGLSVGISSLRERTRKWRAKK